MNDKDGLVGLGSLLGMPIYWREAVSGDGIGQHLIGIAPRRRLLVEVEIAAESMDDGNTRLVCTARLKYVSHGTQEGKGV